MTGRTTGKIAQETQKDAISMRTIALVTLFFLPATFVSAVFEMPFFEEYFNDHAPLVWIYFVSVFLLTAVVVSLWNIWLRRKMRSIHEGEGKYFLIYP